MYDNDRSGPDTTSGASIARDRGTGGRRRRCPSTPRVWSVQQSISCRPGLRLYDEVINSYDGHDGVVGWVCVGKKQEKERIAAMV